MRNILPFLENVKYFFNKKTTRFRVAFNQSIQGLLFEEEGASHADIADSELTPQM